MAKKKPGAKKGRKRAAVKAKKGGKKGCASPLTGFSPTNKKHGKKK